MEIIPAIPVLSPLHKGVKETPRKLITRLFVGGVLRTGGPLPPPTKSCCARQNRYLEGCSVETQQDAVRSMLSRIDNMILRNNSRHRSWLIFLGLVDAFAVGVVAGIFYSHASPTLCSDVPCDRFNIRVWAIENIIRQDEKSPRYLAIGDSITEGAALPDICGRRPINAGIVGATVETFDKLGRRLADLAQPDFIIVALGTNDALNHRAKGFQVRLSALINSLKPWPVIVVPLPPGQGVKDVATI